MDPFPYPWLFAALVGAIILVVVLAYGAHKSSKATPRQTRAAEQGARDLYHKDQSKS